MNIAVISNHSSKNTADLVNAATRAGIDCSVYAMEDVAIDVDNISDNVFFSHDLYIFRGYNKSYSQAQALAQMLVRQGKTVLDKQLISGFIPSKFHEALVYKDNTIRHIPTYSVRSFKKWQALGIAIDYPVVIKDVDSQRARGVRLCHDEVLLKTEIETSGDQIIIQKYIDMPYDLRVICIGDEVLGAIKREAAGDDFRTNVSIGGKATSYTLSDEEKAFAYKAHKSMGYDVSGVDMTYDEQGELVVIETNITPEWQGFASATGIDVASKIIDYAIERYHHDAKR